MTAAGSTPEPPPGPGVWAPFVSAPTDGTGRRRWLAAGLAALVVLVCCAGGVFGLASLVVLTSKVEQNQAQAVVTDYLSALRDEEYPAAYRLLCPELRQRTSLREFTAAQSDQPEIASFTVHAAEIADQVVVPTTVDYVNGSSTTRRYLIDVDSAGELRVCGTAD